jgi:FKBP-type peptidyl-prolyl cis-trans isomerase SlyD
MKLPLTTPLLLAVLPALAGCGLLKKEPRIEEGSSVKIHYTLTVDGQQVDTSSGREPLAFVQGQHMIIVGLEEELAGMKAGEKKTVTVAPEEGYPSNPLAVQTVPRSAFSNPDSLQVGDVVRGNSQGRDFPARVTVITPDSITVDMNHPLAGKTLVFDVEVIEITPPSEKPGERTTRG